MNDDSISRDAVLDACSQSINILDAMSRIEDLPSVTPKQEPTYYPYCMDCNKKMDEIRRTYDKLKEQEPCEDAISRQAVLDAMQKNHRTGGRDIDGDYIEGDYGERLYDDIKSLPPVTPKQRTLESEVNAVLYKIRAEIEKWAEDPCVMNHGCGDEVLRIIDKYTAESEGES